MFVNWFVRQHRHEGGYIWHSWSYYRKFYFNDINTNI